MYHRSFKNNNLHFDKSIDIDLVYIIEKKSLFCIVGIESNVIFEIICKVLKTLQCYDRCNSVVDWPDVVCC